MSYLKITSLSALCLSSAIATACAKKEPEPMTPAASWTPTDIAPPAAPTTLSEPQTQNPPAQQTDRSAIADADRSSTLIATARCEREVRCKNVGGPEGKYVTQEDCVVSLQPATRTELDARDCPTGVSEVELNQCTDEIKQTDCGSPVPNIDLVTECSNDQLCAD